MPSTKTLEIRMIGLVKVARPGIVNGTRQHVIKWLPSYKVGKPITNQQSKPLSRRDKHREEVRERRQQ